MTLDKPDALPKCFSTRANSLFEKTFEKIEQKIERKEREKTKNNKKNNCFHACHLATFGYNIDARAW